MLYSALRLRGRLRDSTPLWLFTYVSNMMMTWPFWGAFVNMFCSHMISKIQFLCCKKLTTGPSVHYSDPAGDLQVVLEHPGEAWNV